MGDFQGAVFDQADLRAADFTGAKLGGVSLRGTDVTDVQGMELG